VSVGIETPAGEMAVGKTPRSRATYLGTSDERRGRDAGWWDGCRQDAAQ